MGIRGDGFEELTRTDRPGENEYVTPKPILRADPLRSSVID